MATGQLSRMMSYIRRVAGPPGAGEATDGQLLERFITGKEESAFQSLVQRHGAMVLSVCRRVLDDLHDAEDAFQATFLVLVRKAGSIGKRDSVGSWLYGVAYRTALKARTAAARRRFHERRGGEMSNPDLLAEVAWRELRPLLDEELNRLPEKYRAPLVFCYLEGKTNEEAARLLGWTKGTVSGRLARARDLLRIRLTRRGLALPAGLLVAALSQDAASASVPALLAECTVKAATLIAAGKAAAAGAVSAKVAALMEGVVKAMFVTKLKIAAALVLAVGLAATGAGVWTYPTLAGEQSETKKQTKSKADGSSARSAQDDAEKIQGTWVVDTAEKNGKPVDEDRLQEMKIGRVVFTAAKVAFKANGEQPAAYDYKLIQTKDPKVIRLSGAEGEFKLNVLPLVEGRTLQGLYALNGNQLRLCINDEKPDGEPPTELKTQPGSGHLLLVMKRLTAQDENKPADKKSIDAANRIRSRQNLKRLALAMHNYEASFGRLPAAASYTAGGNPLLSWRVHILPFLDQDDLYKQFKLDEPWDSEHNKSLLANMPEVYAPPGVDTKDPTVTFYRVFAGVGSVFEGTEGSRLIDIADGTSNTVMIVEAGESVPWTKPADLPYDAAKPLPELGGLFKNGFHMAMCDGSVRSVKRPFDQNIMRALITRAGGEVVDLADLDR